MKNKKIQKGKIIRKNRLAQIILFLYTKKQMKKIFGKKHKRDIDIKNFKERYTYYAR